MDLNVAPASFWASPIQSGYFLPFLLAEDGILEKQRSRYDVVVDLGGGKL
jgi:hypothetical protein